MGQGMGRDAAGQRRRRKRKERRRRENSLTASADVDGVSLQRNRKETIASRAAGIV